MSEQPTVLVVDDQTGLVDLYTEWLEAEYSVKTAYGGREALDRFDETVDVILLDRQMPDLSGDAVLAELRQREITCPVAMITGLEPEVDILELGYDEYVMKPVAREDVIVVVETLLKRADYESAVQDYYRLLSKQTAIRSRIDESDLLDHPKYRALQAEIEAVETKLGETLDEFKKKDYETEFHKVCSPGGSAEDANEG